MCKTHCLFMVCILISSSLFAQAAEGYGGVLWGSSINDAKKIFQDLVESTEEQDRLSNQKVFTQKTNVNVKILRFFNNKLFWGRTVYKDIDTPTLQALMEKLTETYGLFDDSGKGTESGNDYFWSSRNYSNELEIEFRVVLLYDSYGRNISNMVLITYENPTIRNELDKYDIETKKKNLEL